LISFAFYFFKTAMHQHSQLLSGMENLVPQVNFVVPPFYPPQGAWYRISHVMQMDVDMTAA